LKRQLKGGEGAARVSSLPMESNFHLNISLSSSAHSELCAAAAAKKTNSNFPND
jgi:hypothetical protein